MRAPRMANGAMNSTRQITRMETLPKTRIGREKNVEVIRETRCGVSSKCRPCARGKPASDRRGGLRSSLSGFRDEFFDALWFRRLCSGRTGGNKNFNNGGAMNVVAITMNVTAGPVQACNQSTQYVVAQDIRDDPGHHAQDDHDHGVSPHVVQRRNLSGRRSAIATIEIPPS